MFFGVEVADVAEYVEVTDDGGCVDVDVIEVVLFAMTGNERARLSVVGRAGKLIRQFLD